MDLSYSNFLCDQPWILGCRQEENAGQAFFDPIRGIKEERTMPEMRGKLCFGCFGNHLFLWDETAHECSFLDITSLSKIILPSLPVGFEFVRNLSISSSLDCPDCVVFAVGTEYFDEIVPQPFILFCRLNDESWTKVPVDLGDNHLGWTSIVHRGKLYAQGLGVIVVFDVMSLIVGNAEKNIIDAPKYRSYPNGSMGNEQLVESRGDIFLVRICKQGYRGPILCIDIYRMDISSEILNGVWKRVDSIDDRAFLLEETPRGRSICAEDMGVQRNCIYFVECCYDGMRLGKFCFDDQTFTFTFLTSRTDGWLTFCWLLPTKFTRIMEKVSVSTNSALNEANHEEEKEVSADIFGPWVDLAIDVFELILPHLSLVDAVRVRAVCKAWGSIAAPFKKGDTWPWLMYREKDDGTYKLLDPLRFTQDTLKINRLSVDNQHVAFVCSKNGWVVFLIDDCTICMMNPYFQDKVVIPSTVPTDFDCMSFSSVPTCSDCMVILITRGPRGESIIIHLWRPEMKEGEWDRMEFENEVPFDHTHSNPVFFHGEFYILAENGSLGVFNPEKKSWNVFDDLEPILDDDTFHTGFEDCYLLESQGDLICVFRENNDDAEIAVFKLDQIKMEWIELEDLGGETIFLDSRSSVTKMLPMKSWANKIFSNVFDDSYTCELYCMEKQIHSMKLYDSNSKMPMDCVWLEPNLQQN